MYLFRASLHCAAPSYEETDWAGIRELYDALYNLKPSPVVALNRAIAIGNALSKACKVGPPKMRSSS